MTSIAISAHSSATIQRATTRAAQPSSQRQLSTRPSDDAVVLEIAQQLASRPVAPAPTAPATGHAEVSKAVLQILVAAQELANSFEAVMPTRHAPESPSATPITTTPTNHTLQIKPATKRNAEELGSITSFARELSSLSSDGALSLAKLIEATNTERTGTKLAEIPALASAGTPTRTRALEIYDAAPTKDLPRANDFRVAV